jgi:hypothetical protein
MRLLPVYRVTVFVPPEHLDALLAGVRTVDDLRIGDYAHAAWLGAPGVERFVPLATASPARGEAGEAVSTPSVRVEFCLPRDPARLARFVDAGIRPHHPWQVPAIFVDESSLPLP